MSKISRPELSSSRIARFTRIRVRDVHAFSCVGVDFAGPLFLKSKVKDDTEMTKVCIALFTCATSRAVHLELVPS